MCVLKPVLLIFFPLLFSFALSTRLSAETFVAQLNNIYTFLIHESLQILSLSILTAELDVGELFLSQPYII